MTDVAVPGARDVRGSLADPDSDSIVVACPPHPRQGGHRGDRRLVAVADTLSERGVACLRFDYGEWDEGYGEREDARNAIRWAADRYDRVGVFGFSFGSAQAILAGATVDRDVRAVSALAPPDRLAPDLEVVPALDRLACPVQVCYGERDSTVNWEPVVSRARELGLAVHALPADHFFVGQHDKVAATVSGFFEAHLESADR
ncbi:alpha/beta hydrolase [Natrononativus amylolyticus]|uniref:alpha/beta hydrolase n=1 Tax=Natrononativus amylolyticus TaxID=2963434 RepID=UPI0020CBF977|nr:alpha/beta hydrolase [Natrononativus amylolyticus]